jgi:Acyclic terpene utilisation family protein AtuA
VNANESFRVMISTGHLGTAPSGLESFRLAIESGPDVLVADGGSSDPGPVYLGENLELGHFVREELELFVTESRKRGIPFVVGSAGDSGSNDGVDRTVALIKDIAAQHRIARFKIGYFYSEVSKGYLKGKLAAGNTLAGLNGFPNLHESEIEDAARIVAVAGVNPFIKLFDMGADVIVGGRCGDICFTAAPCIRAGFPEALAYHMGKMIECASLVAEPFMGKEAVVGAVSHNDIKITPYHPGQRCTVASTAGHSMYERETPFTEYALGGRLDMSACEYAQFDERTCRITGARWEAASRLQVKIEGAKKLGQRYMGIVGVRDPHVIRNIDAAIDWCRTSIAQRFAGERYELFFHVFGRDAILKSREPLKETLAHEIAVVVEGMAPTDTVAAKLTDLAVRMFFLARIPGAKGTAGTAATTKLPMKTLPGYVWNINHTVPIADPMELFPVHLTEAGV